MRANSAGFAEPFARLDPIAAGILLAVTLRGRTPKLSRALRLGVFACGISPDRCDRVFRIVLGGHSAGRQGRWSGCRWQPRPAPRLCCLHRRGRSG